MRVRIVGSTESSRVLRSYLEKAGVAVSEHLPRFALHCTIHLSEYSGPSIIVDSVDSPLELHILRHITEISKKDIILRRGTESPAIVSAANEIHLSIPTGEPELAHAVEVGVLRGVQRAHFHRPWYRRLLPLALLTLVPAAHASPPPRYSIFTTTESGTVHLIMPAGGLFPQFQTGGSSGGCAGATAPAHTFCGNNSGSVAAPTYSAITAADLPGTITSNTSGLAATATALAATPSLCSAGQAAIGVLASGNATGCFTPAGLANPMTTLGDIIYGAASGVPTRLGANSTATNNFLRSVSSGVPIWAIPTIADIAAGTSSANYTLTGQNALTVSTVNNTVYWDGNKYPLTSAGLSSAITAACNGTIPGRVEFPLTNVNQFVSMTAQIVIPSNCTLHGPGKDRIVLQVSASFNINPVILLTGVSNIRLEGFGCDGNRANNSNGFDCISIQGTSSDIVLSDMRVSNIGGSNGISFLPAAGTISHVTIQDSDIFRNGLALPSANGGNIVFSPTTGTVSHVRIMRNRIHDGTFGAILYNGSAGTIEDTVFSENSIYSNSVSGVVGDGNGNPDGGTIVGTRLVNNDIYCNGWPANGTGFSPNCTAGFLQTGAVQSQSGCGVEFIGNIVSQNVITGNRIHDNLFDAVSQATQSSATIVNTANSAGNTTVTWVSGSKFKVGWAANQFVTVNAVGVFVVSVASTTSMTVATNLGTLTGVAFLGPGFTNSTITSNLVYRNGNSCCGGAGFNIFWSDGNTVSNNIAFQNNVEGIYNWISSFNVYSGNIAFNNQQQTLRNGAYNNSGGSFNQWVNNTSWDSQAVPTQTLGQSIGTNSYQTYVESAQLKGATAISDSGTLTSYVNLQGAAVQYLSGVAATNETFSLGRTAADINIAAVGTGGSFFSDTSAGDGIIRVPASGSWLRFGSGSGTSPAFFGSALAGFHVPVQLVDSAACSAGAGSTVLCSDPNSHNLEVNLNNGSKNQHFPRTCFLIADATGSASATLANITWANSCTFPVAASTVYSYYCDVESTSTNAAGGLFMGITGPVSPVASNYTLSQATSATLSAYHNISQTTTYSTTGAGVVAQTITTTWPAHFAGTFENGTTAGTLSMQFANGSATGSTVLKRGSFCTVQ